MENCEQIIWDGKPLALIIRSETTTDVTTFFTPPEYSMQVGFISYSSGKELTRHVHRPLERHISRTSEVLVLRKGRCLVDIYNEAREHVVTKELRTGDVLLLIDGGHGFRMLEETVFLEIKQGPYTGIDEKERF